MDELGVEKPAGSRIICVRIPAVYCFFWDVGELRGKGVIVRSWNWGMSRCRGDGRGYTWRAGECSAERGLYININ